MAKTSPQSPEVFAASLRSLLTAPEVLRLISDTTTCTVEWEDQPDNWELEASRGLELFPCFTLHFQRYLLKVQGFIYPNLPRGEGLSHLVRLDLAERPLFLRLSTTQATFLLSPFHCRFLSILFGRLVLHHLSMSPQGREDLLPYTPYSLEEQVVAGYLQSLEWAHCATLKLDARTTLTSAPCCTPARTCGAAKSPAAAAKKGSSGPGACLKACSITPSKGNGSLPALPLCPRPGHWITTGNAGPHCFCTMKPTASPWTRGPSPSNSSY